LPDSSDLSRDRWSLKLNMDLPEAQSPYVELSEWIVEPIQSDGLQRPRA
jgi:hypothetical protein